MKIAATITEPYINGVWNLDEKHELAYASGVDILEYKLGLFAKLIREKGEECNLAERLIPKRKRVPIIATSYRYLEGDKEFDKAAYSDIEQLLELGVPDYVDIELTMSRKYLNDVVKLVKKFDKETIISWHNYFKTPEKEFLEKVYEKEIKLGADIPKMCPTATGFRDTARVVRFVERKSEKLKPLCWPMGEEGRTGRIATLPLTPWGFAVFDGSSAPGQLSLEEMKYWRFIFEHYPEFHQKMVGVIKQHNHKPCGTCLFL